MLQYYQKDCFHWISITLLKIRHLFLRGLYSANGSVIKGHRVAFKTTCKALADTLLFVLERDFKIQGYITTNKAKESNICQRGLYM